MNFDDTCLKPMYSRTCDHAPRLQVLLGLTFCLVLASCGANPVKITQESFSIDSPYKARLDSNSTIACESARRVLLGDGYIIDTNSQENTRGRKAYRSDDDRSTFIDMNVVCVDDPNGSTVYANGLLSTYDVKRSGGSASLGVSAIGTVSLPFGQSADSMVKISDETIRDPEFYRRFFKAVNVVMAQIKKAREETVQPVGQALSGQQKQGDPGLGKATQSDSPNHDTTLPAAAEELPPTPLVQPARTAEALEGTHPKQQESPVPVESQSGGDNPSAADAPPAPATATPTVPVESEEPTVSTTPDPAPAEPAVTDPTTTSPELGDKPAAANPAE